MYIKRTLVLLLLSITTIACKTNKQNKRGEQKEAMAELFSMMDHNKDNLLSRTEVREPLTEQFNRIDTDNDNFLSKAEVRAYAKTKKVKPLKFKNQRRLLKTKKTFSR